MNQYTACDLHLLFPFRFFPFPSLSPIRMAGEARTIRVTGLPVGGSENRLIDKLQIHFLRKKNGGGEISSVTVSKTMPGTAFVTFEESEGKSFFHIY